DRQSLQQLRNDRSVKVDACTFVCALHLLLDLAIGDVFVAVDVDAVDLDLRFRVHHDPKPNAFTGEGICLLNNFHFCVEIALLDEVLSNGSLCIADHRVSDDPSPYEIDVFLERAFLAFGNSHKVVARETRALRKQDLEEHVLAFDPVDRNSDVTNQAVLPEFPDRAGDGVTGDFDFITYSQSGQGDDSILI